METKKYYALIEKTNTGTHLIDTFDTKEKAISAFKKRVEITKLAYLEAIPLESDGAPVTYMSESEDIFIVDDGAEKTKIYITEIIK